MNTANPHAKKYSLISKRLLRKQSLGDLHANFLVPQKWRFSVTNLQKEPPTGVLPEQLLRYMEPITLQRSPHFLHHGRRAPFASCRLGTVQGSNVMKCIKNPSRISPQMNRCKLHLSGGKRILLGPTRRLRFLLRWEHRTLQYVPRKNRQR